MKQPTTKKRETPETAWAAISKSDGWILQVFFVKKKPTRREANIGNGFRIVPCEIRLILKK